jgi:integrase
MKMRTEHVVPLPQQAIDVIEALRPLTGRSPYIFPNSRSNRKPLSENSIGYLLNRAGFHHRHVPHGFRAAFSSIMSERYPADSDAIEASLAHAVQGTRGRYMRANFIDRRRELLAEWAGLLMEGAQDTEMLVKGRRR